MNRGERPIYYTHDCKHKTIRTNFNPKDKSGRGFFLFFSQFDRTIFFSIYEVNWLRLRLPFYDILQPTIGKKQKDNKRLLNSNHENTKIVQVFIKNSDYIT